MVLVAYGTKYGATAAIAEAIGEALRGAGLEADVLRARDVRSLDRYSAVVLGSAVYAGRWRRDARRLLKRRELAERPLWLFSSGPVGEPAAEVDRWTRPQPVEDAARRLGAREHVVFAGKVDVDRGFVRKKMARRLAPEQRDQRDWEAISEWGRAIAAALAVSPSPAATS
jgi:menaquinone-dependent protoporphyrinogen oxidase